MAKTHVVFVGKDH